MDHQPNQALIPALSSQTALERKYIHHILRSDPGMGEKSIQIANSLADSGLPVAACAMILQAVFVPATTSQQRGAQGTRLRWFVEAIQNRYQNRMDKIRHDYRAFRSFVSDMEEVTEMRDELNGNGYSISFQGAFLLWEVGECADSIQRMVDDYLPHLAQFKGSAMKRLVEAAMQVQNGVFSEMGSALEFLNPQSTDEQ